MKTLAMTLIGSLAMAALAQQPPVPPPVPPPPAPVAAPAPPAAPRLPASPRGMAATQVAGKWVAEKPTDNPRYRDGKWISVDYARPILRGRKDIFGTGAEYGRKITGGDPVWRAGANQTTRFKSEIPLVIGGKAIPAGEYSLFIDLKDGAWTLILSTQPHLVKWDPNDKSATWGSSNYVPKFDVARVPMKVGKSPISFDQFTIEFVNMTQEGGTLAFWWDKETATVDFKVGQ